MCFSLIQQRNIVVSWGSDREDKGIERGCFLGTMIKISDVLGDGDVVHLPSEDE